MEHLRESKEIVEEAEESPEEPSGVPYDAPPPTRDVSLRGRGRVREMGPPISASFGATRALVWKLGNLLRAPPRNCSSKRVKDGMRLLKEDVEHMSSYIVELSEVEDPPTMAKCWMNEARDLSYDMEDYIDSIFPQAAEEPCIVAKNIKTTRFHHKWFSRFRTPKKEITEFRMYVKDAMKQHEVYGLKYFSTMKRTLVSVGRTLTAPYEGTSDIVINGQMKDFINSLVANDGVTQQQLKVVSVLGSACLGKTTLARVFYNKFGNRFECRAFIRVSRKPDMNRIFCDMIKQLRRQDPPQYYEMIDLIKINKNYLQGKRYLVIIDDIWDAKVWDIIIRAFPKGGQGSRIITTTQIEELAFRCCRYQSGNVFEMKPLDDHHSRELFFNRLFGSENSCPQKLKEVLIKIVQICGGLPLATISIASLLASQPDITEDILKHIHESLISCFSASSTSERTRQALSLSFNNLPHYLKTCLLYLSVYPEGSIIWRCDLLNQWMAENLIDTIEGKDLEEVAESYLDQLIGRRFIEPILVNHNNEVLSFAVHDMVNDLIAYKSAEENFIVAIDGSPTCMELSYKARWLSLQFGDVRFAKIPANIGKSEVRSITYSGFFECMPRITEFKLLRSLNLQLSCYGCEDCEPVHLTGISELFQLRYLKIASDVCIELPNRVLPCLETLDIRDATFSPVPWDVNFPHLLNLHLSLPVKRYTKDQLDSSVSASLVSLGKLEYLQELYLKITTTVNHLDSVKEALGYSLGGHIYNLQSNIEALGPLLGGHGTLKTMALSHVSSLNTVFPATIYWDHVKPSLLLQRFEFLMRKSCLLHRVPRWVGKLGNLRILKIAVEELPIDHLDMLRGLPTLTALSLYVKMAPDGIIFFSKSAGFSVLKYFKLRCAIGLVWLNFEADAMPSLWKLKLTFNDIPSMSRRLPLYSSNQGRFQQHQRGTAFISIGHMPGLREISAKFEGAASDVEYAHRTGFDNHPSNPTINRQPADYSCYGDEGSTEEKQQPADEIVEDEREEFMSNPTINRQPGDYSCYGNEGSTEEKQQPVEEIVEGEPDSIIEEEPDEYEKTLDRTGDKSIPSPHKSSSPLHIFTMSDLISATGDFSENNFCQKYRSDFSTQNYVDELLFIRAGVYRGSFDGNIPRGLVPQEVAIKCLDISYVSDRNRLTELEYLGRARHPHIVTPLGFCETRKYIMLVYEYMPKGSLVTHLFKTMPRAFPSQDNRYLPWFTRLNIALGAAKGLAFLHNADKQMVHGDVTASNVLLDKDYTAKLSGFGPRRERPLGCTVESDVYNFGVVLLELLAGHPADEEVLVKWSNLRREEELPHIMDKKLRGVYSKHAAWSTATMASRCLMTKPEERPSMRDVIEALEPLLKFGNDDTAGGDKPTHPSLHPLMGLLSGIDH